MVFLNKDVVKKKEYELIHFPDFIPFDFFMYIDMLKRNNYLKKMGKFNNIQKINYKVRQNIKQSNNPDVYSDKVLLKWIEENPQFKDCID